MTSGAPPTVASGRELLEALPVAAVVMVLARYAHARYTRSRLYGADESAGVAPTGPPADARIAEAAAVADAIVAADADVAADTGDDVAGTSIAAVTAETPAPASPAAAIADRGTTPTP